jgi:hypothetical protein
MSGENRDLQSAAGPAGMAAPRTLMSVTMADGRVFRFAQAFYIGRGEECELRIDEPLVSRRHLLVTVTDGEWGIQDLRSSNGTFSEGRRIASAPVSDTLTVSLGREGTTLVLAVEQPGARPAAATRFEERLEGETDEVAADAAAEAGLDDYAKRYFGAEDDSAAGPRTMMIRRAYREVQKKQKRKYGGLVAALAVALVIAGAYAYTSYREMLKQRAQAEELFYSIKAIDVSIANLERQLAGSGDAGALAAVRQSRADRQEMERNYDEYVQQYYGRRLDAEERAILRVTRIFGECELAAPEDYLRKVKAYIRGWQSTGRFERAMKVAQQNGYIPVIARQFVSQGLPPQFVYLAMQESDFYAFASGPPTYAGIAKGMWQFIPSTGRQYGLKIGPLEKQRAADVDDDRHKWDRATVAASKYIKDLYATEAQASGLLVMASYNWGEGRVIRLMRTLAATPRERNFWKLQQRYRACKDTNKQPPCIPDETYNYVFSIVSAAVIGENPRGFGFQFDNPLASVDLAQAAAR